MGAFKQREYSAASICKPYIFRRVHLLITEIIITTFPKPLIKSAHSVGTFERRFSCSWFKHMRVKVEVIGQSLIFAKSPYPSPHSHFDSYNHAKLLSTLCYNALAAVRLLSGDTFSSRF